MQFTLANSCQVRIKRATWNEMMKEIQGERERGIINSRSDLLKTVLQSTGETQTKSCNVSKEIRNVN